IIPPQLQLHSAPFTLSIFLFFSFNHPSTTEIYTLSLHDALPISAAVPRPPWQRIWRSAHWEARPPARFEIRRTTTTLWELLERRVCRNSWAAPSQSRSFSK